MARGHPCALHTAHLASQITKVVLDLKPLDVLPSLCLKVVPEKLLLKVLPGIEAAGLVRTGMAQGVPMLHNFENLFVIFFNERKNTQKRKKIYYKLNF